MYELQFPIRLWATVMSAVHLILNQTKMKRLGHKCGLTLFTGLKETHQVYSSTEQIKSTDVNEAPQRCQNSPTDLCIRSPGFPGEDAQKHRQLVQYEEIESGPTFYRTNRQSSSHIRRGDFVTKSTLKKACRAQPVLRWHVPGYLVQVGLHLLHRVHAVEQTRSISWSTDQVF